MAVRHGTKVMKTILNVINAVSGAASFDMVETMIDGKAIMVSAKVMKIILNVINAVFGAASVDTETMIDMTVMDRVTFDGAKV